MRQLMMRWAALRAAADENRERGIVPQLSVMRGPSLAASRCEIVTVAVRRVQSSAPGHGGLDRGIDWVPILDVVPTPAGLCHPPKRPCGWRGSAGSWQQAGRSGRLTTL